MMLHAPRWQTFFMRLALLNAEQSKDPSTKVGAVIVRPNKTVCSMGWNGPPRGVSDAFWQGERDRKLAVTLHAEENAILTASEPVVGMSIYVTCMPCAHCMAVLIQAGIRAVYCLENPDFEQRWAESIRRTLDMAHEMDMPISYVEQKLLKEIAA